jgi:hypothetical protein
MSWRHICFVLMLLAPVLSREAAKGFDERVRGEVLCCPDAIAIACCTLLSSNSRFLPDFRQLLG